MANEYRGHAAHAALGDPTRRAILERLAVNPAPVGDIAATLPVTRSAVSQHLHVLKEAQLVDDTQVGTRRIYRIDPRGIGAVRGWLDAMWTRSLADFARFADAVEEEEQSE